jgi:hypothetical protein
MVVYECNPSYVGGPGRRNGPRLAQAKSARLYLKDN